VRRDAKALDALAGFLKDSDPVVAQAAARSLGRIGTFTAVTSLDRARAGVPETTLLAFCEGAFRCAEALMAKGRNGEAESIYDRMRELKVPHQVKAGALRGAILTRKKDGMNMLLQALRGEDYAMAEAAARTSMEMPGAEVTKALADELARLPADRQVLAVLALSKRGDAEALPALFEAAKSGDKDVRVAAIKAFPEIGDAKAVPVLKELAEDSDSKVAKAAKESLAALPNA
jgi:HEAT repeat protein